LRRDSAGAGDAGSDRRFEVATERRVVRGRGVVLGLESPGFFVFRAGFGESVFTGDFSGFFFVVMYQ
jgi:hypothetical protein